MASALLFPGQGSHSDDMAEAYADHPRLRQGLDLLGFDPFTRLAEGTAMQQPAIFLVSVCAWDDARAAGELDDAVACAGHSLGDFAALVAGGALAFEDAVGLVAERGAAMAEAAEQAPQGMVAMLGGAEHDVRALADELGLTVANDNAPGQLVLAGAEDAVVAAVDAASRVDARAMRLDVQGAFHSPLMQPAADRLVAALERTPFATPGTEVWSSGSAAPFPAEGEAIARELAENLLRGVRFRELLLALRARGVDRYVELGPGRVLSGLVKRTIGRQR